MRNRLNRSNPDVLLRECDVAELLDVSVRTLQAWRTRREGPDFVVLSRAVRYSRADLMAWIETRKQSSKLERKAVDGADATHLVAPRA